MRGLAFISAFAVAALIGGCNCGAEKPGSDAGEEPPDAATEEASDAGDSGTPDAGPQFLERTEAARDSGVIFESFTYASGALQIHGQLCRPEDDGGVAHPLIVRGHSGLAGLGDESFDAFCSSFARDGFVVASSSFRGEDGSGGTIEVCLGEVDDAQALLALLRNQSFVDGARVGAIGEDHGGCVMLELTVRDPSLKAAVTVAGVGDYAAAHKFWDRQLSNNEPPPCPADAGDTCSFVHSQLLAFVETATGGRPAGKPEEYAARSPALRLGDVDVPLLVIQGEDDYVTAVDQACRIEAALTATGRTFAAWHLDASLLPTAAPALCDGNFSSASPPEPKTVGSLDANARYLFIYEGQGNAFTEPAASHASSLVMRFLKDRLK